MRLFSRTGATAVDDPEYGHFEPSAGGAFDFPDDLSDRLVRFHRRGQPMWETEIEQQARLGSEDLARRRDPATLYSAVDSLVEQFSRLTQGLSALSPAATAAEADPAPAKSRSRGKSAPAAGADGDAQSAD